ncbi:MAG TPA: O-antigen ligase family protein [Ktedonobacterales bacterium]|nr:O-antigen ligase family protein [Ktedonobacterales bacterium]
MALHVPALGRRSPSPVRFIGLGLCLAFTLFFLWPNPPASLLLLVVAAVLAYLRLEIAVALLPLTFPYFEHLEPLSPSGFPAFSLSELGLFICLGVMVLRHVFMAEERRVTAAWLKRLWQQAGVFFAPALLFLVGASLALLVSPDKHNSLRAYRWEIIEPLLYFLLMLRYLRTRADVARAVGALILAGLVAACIGIIQGVFYLTPNLDIVNATTFRIQGPYTDPNNLAFLFDRTIPILLAVAFLGVLHPPAESVGSQRSVWRDPLRWVCLALLVPLLWALYWTDSRGAEIAVLLVALCFFVVEVRRWVVALVVGGVGILGVVIFWHRIIAFLNESTHAALSQRLYLWKAGLLIIRDHFLLGTGPDSFNTLYRPTAPNSYLLQALDGQTAGAPSPTLSHPHDFILDFWISSGLLGEVALFWLLGAFAVVIRRTYRLCAGLMQASLLQRLVLGIAGAMLASVIHGLVDNLYFLPDLALIFWFFLGLLLVVKTIVQQEHAALHDEKKQQDEEVFAA